MQRPDLFAPDDAGRLRLLLRRAGAALLDPAPEAPACEEHDWPPPGERASGKPKPPRSLCPDCRQEAEQKYERTGVTIYAPSAHESDDPRETPQLAAMRQRIEAVRLARGEVLPGSLEEDEALERIDALREEARRREAAKAGRDGYVFTERIEQGRVVQYVATGRYRNQISRRVLG